MRYITILVLVLVCGNLWGYSLYDGRPHWTQDITYWVPDTYRDTCDQAVFEWSLVLGDKIVITRVDDPLLANVLIIDNWNPSSTDIANTQCFLTDGLITHALIRVYLPEFLSKACLVHEWGHVLGLDHSYLGSIMYHIIDVSLNQPQADDINGICDLYGISYVLDIPIKVRWLRGRWFVFNTYAYAMITDKNGCLYQPGSKVKVLGKLPQTFTVRFRGFERSFLVTRRGR